MGKTDPCTLQTALEAIFSVLSLARVCSEASFTAKRGSSQLSAASSTSWEGPAAAHWRGEVVWPLLLP